MNFNEFLIFESNKSDKHLFPDDWLSIMENDGKDVTLYHYGANNLYELDPKHWGKHRYTESESWWGLKRVYFYLNLKDKERIVNGQLYKVVVPLKDLYPFNIDPLGIYNEIKIEKGYKTEEALLKSRRQARNI